MPFERRGRTGPRAGCFELDGTHPVRFSKADVVFAPRTRLPGHPNAMTLEAWTTPHRTEIDDAARLAAAGIRTTGSGRLAFAASRSGRRRGAGASRDVLLGGRRVHPPRGRGGAGHRARLPARVRQRRGAAGAVRRARHHDRRGGAHQRGGPAQRRGDRRGARRDLGRDVGLRRGGPALRRRAARAAAGQAPGIGDPRAARGGGGRTVIASCRASGSVPSRSR